MLLLSFTLYCALSTSTGSPTSISPALRAKEEPLIDTNHRSAIDILWSSFGTIFACTWISVHPNVTGYKSTWWARTRERLKLFVWALLFPELILMWAFRQWSGARKIGQKMGDTWGPVHGHFLQMGGFVFRVTDEHGGYYHQYLDPDSLLESEGPPYVAARTILNEYDITIDEIMDRSKGDGLAKGIVVLQTSWFIIQCIGRGVQHLAITELEVVTLAYAALNGVMYFLWWDKPLDVQCPIVVPIPVEQYVCEPEKPTEYIPAPPWTPRLIAQFPWHIIQIFFGHMKDIAGLDYLPDMISSRFPTFYAEDKMSPSGGMIMPLLASGFGAIHCIAWTSTFPHPALDTIWRVCSLFIVISPLTGVTILLFGLASESTPEHWPSIIGSCLHGGGTSVAYIFLASMLLYIPARIILLVIAFWTLRDLPLTAHQTVEWANFIPHI